jgi:hypothetical protein
LNRPLAKEIVIFLYKMAAHAMTLTIASIGAIGAIGATVYSNNIDSLRQTRHSRKEGKGMQRNRAFDREIFSLEILQKG